MKHQTLLCASAGIPPCCGRSIVVLLLSLVNMSNMQNVHESYSDNKYNSIFEPVQF